MNFIFEWQNNILRTSARCLWGQFEPKFSPKLLSELRLDKCDHTVIQLDALKPDNSVSKFRKRKRKSLTKREIRHFHIVVVQ